MMLIDLKDNNLINMPPRHLHNHFCKTSPQDFFLPNNRINAFISSTLAIISKYCLKLYINNSRFVFTIKWRVSQMRFHTQKTNFSHFELLWLKITTKQVRFPQSTYHSSSSVSHAPSRPSRGGNGLPRERPRGTVMKRLLQKKHSQVVISSHKHEREMSEYTVSFYLQNNSTSYCTIFNTFFRII